MADSSEVTDTSETIAALEGETIPGFEAEEQQNEQMEAFTAEASQQEAEDDAIKQNLIFNSKAFKEKYGLAPGDPDEFSQYDETRGIKRTTEEDDGKKKKKKKSEKGPMQPKNAVMQLNELKPGIDYEMVSLDGPVHQPVFRMQVYVNGRTFEGTGPTKKKAKLVCAERALTSFFPELMDDSVEGGMHEEDETDGLCAPGTDEEKKPKAKKPKLATQHKNAVQMINEYYHGTSFQFEEAVTSNMTGDPHFTAYVTIEGMTWEGHGRSKKQAKMACAISALAGLKRYGYLEVRDEELKLSRKSKNQKKEKWKESYEKQLLQEGGEDALAELDASKFKQPKVDADGNPIPKGPTQNKNAIMILNDKYKGLEYELVSQTPLTEGVLFTMSVTVGNRTFVGQANQKRKAKLDAAENACKALSLPLQISADGVELNQSLLTEDDRQAKKAPSWLVQRQTRPGLGSGEEHTFSFGGHGNRGRGKRGGRGGRGGKGSSGFINFVQGDSTSFVESAGETISATAGWGNTTTATGSWGRGRGSVTMNKTAKLGNNTLLAGGATDSYDTSGYSAANYGYGYGQQAGYDASAYGSQYASSYYGAYPGGYGTAGYSYGNLGNQGYSSYGGTNTTGYEGYNYGSY